MAATALRRFRDEVQELQSRLKSAQQKLDSINISDERLRKLKKDMKVSVQMPI